MKEYNISQAAQILGVSKYSLTYWEKQNLIPKARRDTRTHYRVYNRQEIEEIAKLRGITNYSFDI